jgi:hypothetical protein
MADRLPELLDRWFLMQQAAAMGCYKPTAEPRPTDRPKDPDTVRAAANRELDAFAVRGHAAIRAYQQKKRGR